MGDYKEKTKLKQGTLTEIDPDRRYQSRVGTRFQCWMSRDSITLLGKVVNLSVGGLFLHCTHHLSVGSQVELSLNLGEQTILSWGRVVWTDRKTVAGGQFGIGVAFDRIIRGQEYLKSFVSERAALPSVIA